jgi:hypothetical protein
MKKIALILMCASIASVMVATESQHRTEMVQSRGQPEFQPMSYNFVVSEYVGSAEITLTSVEVYATETSPLIYAISSNVASAPGITTGDRKVRDVDLCSTGNLYTNTNTDKRNALSGKTVKLPRGAISCSLT